MSEDLDNQLAYQRGVQAAIWGMPAVSLASLRDAMVRDLGARPGDVVYMSDLPLPRHELPTANDEVPFAIVMLDLRRGPMVVEVPAALETPAAMESPAKAAGFSFAGSAVDAWMVPLADLGAAGEDRRQAARYVFLPPGYDGAVPAGLHAVKSPTFDLYVSLRPVGVAPATVPERVEYVKRIRVAALAPHDPRAPAGEAQKGRYIDAHPKSWRTLPSYDMTFFERLARIVDREPFQERDAAMMGMVATLGIRKGAPFLPEGRMVRVLEQAVGEARRQMEHYFETPGLGCAPYRPDGQWVTGNRTPHDGATFMVDGKLLIDERAGGDRDLHRLRAQAAASGRSVLSARAAGRFGTTARRAERLPPAGAPARAGARPLVVARLRQGLEGIPYNQLDRVGVSSRDLRRFNTNADGSMDVYFGPEAPPGEGPNWVPTGGDFFLIFWLHGPEAAVLGRSFRMPDLERMH